MTCNLKQISETFLWGQIHPIYEAPNHHPALEATPIEEALEIVFPEEYSWRVDGVKLVDVMSIIAEMSDCAMELRDRDELKEVLLALYCSNGAQMLDQVAGPITLNSALVCTYAYWMHAHIRSSTTLETDLRKSIQENIGMLIPGATLCKGRCLPKHKPDLWVLVDGAELPIEIKKDAPSQKSVDQIIRYMTIFNCHAGYLMSPFEPLPGLNIPENIKFVLVNGLLEKEALSA